jgi:hypothetical protein
VSETPTYPAPDLSVVESDQNDWARERRAFKSLLPSLMATHRGRYVAIHHGKVVAEGADKATVALEAYTREGYVPIFVGQVSDAIPEPVRIRSPRNLGGAGSTA